MFYGDQNDESTACARLTGLHTIFNDRVSRYHGALSAETEDNLA